MNYAAYFVRDPKLCGGETVVKGTRVNVKTVLASLAEGARVEEIIAASRRSPKKPSVR